MPENLLTVELFRGQGVRIHQSFVGGIVGCVFDYYRRDSLVSILESEISLDSDPRNPDLSWWIGTSCCFGFNYVCRLNPQTDN